MWPGDQTSGEGWESEQEREKHVVRRNPSQGGSSISGNQRTLVTREIRRCNADNALSYKPVLL